MNSLPSRIREADKRLSLSNPLILELQRASDRLSARPEILHAEIEIATETSRAIREAIIRYVRHLVTVS